MTRYWNLLALIFFGEESDSVEGLGKEEFGDREGREEGGHG